MAYCLFHDFRLFFAHGGVAEWVSSECAQERTGEKTSPGEHEAQLFVRGCDEKFGGVAEWSKATDLNSVVAARLPWVRIPPPPP